MFSPVNEWHTIAFVSPYQITITWVMLKIFIYNLLWLAEYQCKGVVKFNFSHVFFLGSVSEIINWKNLLLALIAVTTKINLDRCILQFKRLKFPIFIFYFRPALFFEKQVIIIFFSLNFTSIEIEGERVSSSQNERTLGGWRDAGGARKGTRANKGGGEGGRGQN